MPNIFQGAVGPLTGRLDGSQIAIVVSRYNDSITKRLLEGACQTLANAGISDSQIDIAWVPGAWEIPVAAARFAESERYAAVICLGVVIKGETTHDQYINSQVSNSLGLIALENRCPVLFGLLTCNSVEQAIERAGGSMGNKGVECAEAALEMISLLEQLP